MINLFGLLDAVYRTNKQIDEDFGTAKIATPSSAGNSQLKSNLHILEANIAKCLLINEAVWELVKEKINLQDEDLYQKIEEIDLRDGALDGKNQKKAVKCKSCGHKVSSRHTACLYCGNIVDKSIFGMV